MKVELEGLVIENYKCFQEKKEFHFSHRTKISGRNRSGKSTIQDAYFDLLTGKMADGTLPDKIRPHDENGTDIDKVDIIREVYLEIDEKPVVIRKRTFQKWRKPRNQAQEVFDGNGVDYEIDGFSYKPERFKEYISGMVNPDTLLLCSNPNVFLSILRGSTVEARKLLEKLAGFSIEQFIAKNPQYSHVESITRGHSTEETIKKLKKQLATQKKKIEEQNTKIKYEKTRDSDTPKIEISDLELMKAEWQEKIAEADKQETLIEESVKAYDVLSADIRGLKEQAQAIADKANSGNVEQWQKLNRQIRELEQKKQDITNDMRMAEIDLKHADMSIQRHSMELKKAQQDYLDWSNRQFDETKMHEMEAESFDEESLVCPTCGQAYQQDKAEQMRSDFEKSKAKRIKAEEKKREEFVKDIENRLAEITKIGNTAKQELQSAKAIKENAQKKIEQGNHDIAEICSEIEKLSKEMDQIPQFVDLSSNEEYADIQKQIAEKEAELLSLGNSSSQRAEIRSKRNGYVNEIAKIDAQIQNAVTDQEQKERNLAKLERELREMSQVAADIEREIDMVSEFSRVKNAALAEKINPYFDAFHFVFLESTIEGNPVETLKMVRNGTSYFGGLNYSDQILCNVSLVCGLQKMNGLNLPVWVDNSESINDIRLPEIEQQMIVLKVSDGDLMVEEVA